ncbi:MAG: hypothetical protein WAN44_06415 [Propionibacteriaceae bacterium]
MDQVDLDRVARLGDSAAGEERGGFLRQGVLRCRPDPGSGYDAIRADLFHAHEEERPGSDLAPMLRTTPADEAEYDFD